MKLLIIVKEYGLDYGERYAIGMALFGYLFQFSLNQSNLPSTDRAMILNEE